jgi:hypothetical protein
MRTISLTAASLILCASARALAGNEAAADALFREGQTLFDAGRTFEACNKFEESQRLDPQLGRLLNVAFCHEAEGRAASAMSEYEEAAMLAASRDQKEREQFARAHAVAVRSKLSFVRLDLAGARPTEVWIDARRVGEEQWPGPIPIDPGAHAITVVSQGNARVVSVVVPEHGEEHVHVDVEATRSAPEKGGGRPWQSSLGLAIGGAGVLALGAGIGFAIGGAVLDGETGSHCIGTVCDVVGGTKLAQSRMAWTLAVVGMAGGGAMLAGSAILLLTGPRARPASTSVTPMLGVHVAGVAVSGSW